MSLFPQPLQGRFTSTGNTTTIQLPGGVDWMEVINFTEATTPTGSHGVSYKWQRGLADNNGFVTLRNAGATADLTETSAALAVGGFTFVDTSINTPGAASAITAVTAANPPVVSSGTLPAVGDIVRIYGLDNQPQLSGIDYTVTVSGGGAFTLGFGPSQVGSVASTAGFWRKIPYQPMWYPPHRVISSITQAAQAVVKLTVTHQYTIGQQIRFNIPPVFGMQEINGLTGNIVQINTGTNTITVDINSTAFSAFAWPVSAALVPFTPAFIVPVGETANNTIIDGNGNPLNSNLLDDAMTNVAFIGMQLAAGITSPAGTVGQVVYWRAGTSYNVDNQ